MRTLTTSRVPACPRRRSSLLVALTAVCCAAAITACGSSNRPNAGGSGSGSLVTFAVCMRSHGVPNFPDATSGPNGGVSIVPAGINTSAPAFKQAWSGCRKLLPGMGAHQPASAQATEQLLKFSECMRARGVSGFPDPTGTPPSGHGYYSAMIRRGGAYLAIPDTINTASPTYKQAASACRFGPIFS